MTYVLYVMCYVLCVIYYVLCVMWLLKAIHLRGSLELKIVLTLQREHRFEETYLDQEREARIGFIRKSNWTCIFDYGCLLDAIPARVQGMMLDLPELSWATSMRMNLQELLWTKSNNSPFISMCITTHYDRRCAGITLCLTRLAALATLSTSGDVIKKLNSDPPWAGFGPKWKKVAARQSEFYCWLLVGGSEKSKKR